MLSSKNNAWAKNSSKRPLPSWLKATTLTTEPCHITQRVKCLCMKEEKHIQPKRMIHLGYKVMWLVLYKSLIYHTYVGQCKKSERWAFEQTTNCCDEFKRENGDTLCPYNSKVGKWSNAPIIDHWAKKFPLRLPSASIQPRVLLRNRRINMKIESSSMNFGLVKCSRRFCNL